MKTNSRKTVVVSCVAVFFAVAFLALFIHEGYPQRIIQRLSPSKQIEYHAIHNDKALDAWENCLNQLHQKVDIVFFGDSITRRGNFDSYFPDTTICNLGMGSDTLIGMTDRIGMISSVSPSKLFVLGGINSLRDNTLEKSIQEYGSLLSAISGTGIKDVYVISVLPIDKSSSDSIICSPQTITSFNSSIEILAKGKNYKYIDLHSLFADSNGFIKPELTTDGVHLTDEVYLIFSNAIAPLISDGL